MSKVTYTPGVPVKRPPGTFTVELTEVEASEIALLLGSVVGGNTFAVYDALLDAIAKAGISEAPLKSVTVSDRTVAVQRSTY